MEKLNKNQIIEIISEKTHISKCDSKKAIDLFFQTVENSLLEGIEVNISNFGSFIPKTRKERNGTDPKTHKIINIKEKKTINFKLSKNFKKKLS